MTAIELRRTALFCVLFGLYLTLRGYHSFEGDQAYRFPILKHAQDFRLYADDPFVRSFDHFNPHRGYFALLDSFSWPWGLATAVFLLYAMTCAVTAAGVDRLACAVWPNVGAGVGVAALGMFLLAQAGNIGTNHLFEPILYERLLGFGLGWVAIALLIVNPVRGGVPAACALALASFIHPSVGLQLALTLGAACAVWGRGWMDRERVPSNALRRRALARCIGAAGSVVQSAAFGIADRRAFGRTHSPVVGRAAKSSTHVASSLAKATVGGLGMLPVARRVGAGQRAARRRRAGDATGGLARRSPRGARAAPASPSKAWKYRASSCFNRSAWRPSPGGFA